MNYLWLQVWAGLPFGRMGPHLGPICIMGSSKKSRTFLCSAKCGYVHLCLGHALVNIVQVQVDSQEECQILVLQKIPGRQLISRDLTNWWMGRLWELINKAFDSAISSLQYLHYNQNRLHKTTNLKKKYFLNLKIFPSL